MSFKPLGYRFEVSSVHPPEQVKEALRAKKKGWFDPKAGPRGWIVGPFICLWLSAFDRQGPMVLAKIEPDGFGTKVVGRAGSDLNGSLMFLLLTPYMGWLVFKMHEAGQGSFRAYAVIAIVFGLGLPFTLWWNHKDRKHAEPLVRFIERALGREKAVSKMRVPPLQRSTTPVEGTVLIVDGVDMSVPPSPATIAEAIGDLEPDGFMVVQFGRQYFMQTAKKYDRFILEKRDGSDAKHYRVPDHLDEEQVVDALCSYLHDPSSDCGLPRVQGFGR